MSQDSVAPQNLFVTDGPSADGEGRRRRQKVLGLLRGRYHWAIIAALLLGVTGATAGYFYQSDRYESRGRLEIRPQIPSYDGRRGGVPPMWNEFVNTRLSVMATANVVEAAMATNGWRQAVAETGADYSMADFGRSIQYERVRESNLVDVRFEAEHPKLAMAGLDALLTAYMQTFDALESQSDAAMLRVLNDRRSKLTADIQRWRYQKQQIGGESGSETLAPRFEFALKQALALEAEVATLDRILGTGEQAQQQADQEQAESPLAQMSAEELAAIDVTLRNLEADRRLQQNAIEELKLQGFSDQHYAVRRAQSILTIVEQRAAQRVQMLRSGQVMPDSPGMDGQGTTDRQQLAARQRTFKQQLAEVQAEVETLGQRLRQVQDIETQIGNAEAELQEIRSQIDRMDLEKLLSGRLHLVSAGVTPTRPSNGMRRVKMAAVGGMGGAMLGVGMILLIGLLDPRLRHISDAETDLPSTQVLGTLPTLPADLVDAEQAVLVAHSVHHIRTLLQIGRESERAVFSITSPAPGSGKTSLTMALGLSFAASGAKTLLIDADIVGGGLTRRMGFVVHPRVGRVLRHQGLVTEAQIAEALNTAQTSGVKLGQALIDLGYITAEDLQAALDSQQDESIGLLDACADERFEECVAPTGIDNLSLLPIGMALPQQAGALSPGAIRRVIQQARAQFDIVLIDTGPLLGSLEASMAASEADATVFIVSRGDAKPLVTRCMEQLERVDGRLAGIVFNHALAHDIARSTYGSVTMSQSRHPNNHARVEHIDADTSARFGPLATAVASYAAAGDGPRRRNVTHGNGNGHGNGHATNGKHHHTNGRAT